MRLNHGSIKIVLLLAVFLSGCESLDKLSAIGSKGTLVAAPGMTMAEVRQRSSLKLAPDYNTGSETTVTLSDPLAFDFELDGTGLRFQGCRFYSLWMKNPDPQLNFLQIQVVKKLTWPQVKEELKQTQEKLIKDGWTPMVFEDGSNAQQKLSEALLGKAPAKQVGFAWSKGNISLVYSAIRFPQTTYWENPEEGANYEEELEIRPKR